MLEYKTGNIFEDDAEAIVNTVNCVGIMGRGIALQCKRLYPENFKAYAKACKTGQVVPGKMFVYETNCIGNPRIIINFPTKRHWRQNSSITDIVAGLTDFIRVIAEYQVKSVAIPPLGCGNGGLAWDVVRPLLEASLKPVENVVFRVYVPQADIQPLPASEPPKMTIGRAALVSLMQRYLDGLMDPFISLLEVHKLMYFLQEAGMDLKLNYVKHFYGPYAKNLGQVLNRVEGYFITGYKDGGDAPQKPLAIVPGVLPEANQVLAEKPQIAMFMQRVFELIDGFESPGGMELLATVHWTVCKENVKDLPGIVQFIHRWNEHKRQFSEAQIKLSYDRLQQFGWIR